jgi:hypothetical protein
MEKIFFVKDQLEPKIIGRSFPQVTDSDDEQLQAENMKRVREDKFKNVPSDGYSVKMPKSAKMTDYISSFLETHTPIVSERLVRLLQKFHVPQYQLIPIRIYKAKELVAEPTYSIMSFLGNDIASIDFKRSSFDYFAGGANLDRSLLQFEDYEDYRNKVAKDDRVEMAIIQKTVMKPALKNDLFFLGIFCASAFFVRERLKDAMEHEQITGFRFEEAGYAED